MDQLGCKRYCCRRMIMTHVDLIEKLLKYVTPMQSLLAAVHTCTVINGRDRYNPAERDAKKAAMA
jgi:hypothetical protein